MGFHAYLTVPLLAAVLCAGFGAGILMIGPRQRPNRASALLLFGAAFWAACEVLWSVAPDADTALWLHRLSAPGWAFLGPNAVNLVCGVTEVRLARLQRLLPAFYGIAFVFMLLAFGSDAMLVRMEPVAFGFALVPGPVFTLWFAFTASLIGVALASWMRVHRRSYSRVDRVVGARTGWMMMGPAVVGCMTDAVLPIVGVQLPRLATLACASVGGAIVLALRRYGFSVLDPESFSRRILGTLPDGVVLTSLNGRIRLANARMDELLGCAPGGATDLAIADHVDLPLLDPPAERRDEECELVQLSGRRIPVAISAAPLTDDHGDLQGLVLVVRDRREIASLRVRLLTSSRLAAVGQLAAGIAHEINNPLAYVRANLGHLQREWESVLSALEKQEAEAGLRSAVVEWGAVLDESREGVDRAVAIVRDVRDFSHTGGEERELADLNAMVESALRMAGPQLAPTTRVERAYREVPPVLCSPQRLKQLFLNLIVNAAQAVRGAGRVRIETLRDGDRAVTQVIDDGCGIAPADLERIFDPFFTTKPAGEGTGLGLAISHEIARSHGGEIRVESEPGRGTTVSVTIPLAPAPLHG